jgi:hypothetical protein
LLKQLKEDLSLDLYVRLGKSKVAKEKAAGKAAETGATDPITANTKESAQSIR